MEETTDERDFEQGKGACGGATEGFPLVTVQTWCGKIITDDRRQIKTLHEFSNWPYQPSATCVLTSTSMQKSFFCLCAGVS